MFTVDANRCPACPHKEECEARTKIIQTLSALANELNTGKAYLKGPADGIIILACKAKA
jgi:hypothetical protein